MEGCGVAHGWMATGTSFLKEEGGGGGPSGVPQADGTVVRPKDTDTVFFAPKVSNKQPLVLNYMLNFYLQCVFNNCTILH